MIYNENEDEELRSVQLRNISELKKKKLETSLNNIQKIVVGRPLNNLSYFEFGRVGGFAFTISNTYDKVFESYILY